MWDLVRMFQLELFHVIGAIIVNNDFIEMDFLCENLHW
jgi:hypothetical protein